MKVIEGKFGAKEEAVGPNQELVKMLEDLLNDAKDGKITQIAFCGIGSTVHDGFWVHPDTRGWVTVGQMHSLMAEINTFIEDCLKEAFDQ